MKIFVDTNIFIDILLDREPFVEQSALVYKLCENGLIEGHIAPITVNNIHYICRKAHNTMAIKAFLHKVSRDFTIAPMDSITIEKANSLSIGDYEDALQYAMALQVGAEYLLTRNTKDFKHMTHIKVCTPEMFIAEIG